jgi:hypothetical protein
MAATREELAFELSRAAIEHQEKRRTELRSRAGTVVAAASIAASVLTAQAGRGVDLDVFGAAAVIAFVACIATSLYVLLPHELVLEFRGTVLLDQTDRADADLRGIHRTVTEWLDEFHQRNAAVLDRLTSAYTVGCASLGAEIVLWTLSYGDRLFP